MWEADGLHTVKDEAGYKKCLDFVQASGRSRKGGCLVLEALVVAMDSTHTPAGTRPMRAAHDPSLSVRRAPLLHRRSSDQPVRAGTRSSQVALIRKDLREKTGKSLDLESRFRQVDGLMRHLQGGGKAARESTEPVAAGRPGSARPAQPESTAGSTAAEVQVGTPRASQ